MTKHTVQDGLRMVGHLLEHHPTTGANARTVQLRPLIDGYSPGASCWCLEGACEAVAKVLSLSEFDLKTAAICKVEGRLVSAWDYAESISRREIVRRLKAS